MTLYRFEHWQLDTARQTLVGSTGEVAIEFRLLQLLQLFCEQPGHTLSKEVMLARVWGGKVVSDDTLYVSINQLRKILADSPRQPRLIQTIPGVGYRFIGEVKQGRPSRWPLPSLTIALAAGALIIASGALAWWLWPNAPATALPPASISDDFRRARFLLTQQTAEHTQALPLLQDIVTREPDFAPAHVELANLYLNHLLSPRTSKLADLDTIEQHIHTALQLAPENPDAQRLAGNYAFWVDWDMARAESHYRQTLGTAAGHHAYAQFLLAQREFAAAHEHVVQYQLLDPAGYSQPAVAWIANMSGDSHRALQELENIASVDSDSYYYHQSLQATYELLGRHAEAYRELRWLMQHAGYPPPQLARLDTIFQREGLAGIYHWLAFVDTEQRDIGQYTPPLSLARYAAKANAPERAIVWLQQALALHQTQLLWLAADPAYASLRDHPQFRQIVQKLGLQTP